MGATAKQLPPAKPGSPGQRVRFRSDGLTEREDLFCREYLKDLNGQASLVRAGYNPGNAKTASVQVANLLGRTRVQNRLDELKAERNKTAEVSAASVLEELLLLAKSNVDDFYYDHETGRVEVRDGNRAKLRAIESVEKTTVTIGGKKKTRIRFRLWSKPSSVKLLMQHMGMLVEKREISGPDGKPIQHQALVVYMPSNGRDLTSGPKSGQKRLPAGKPKRRG